jgi:hypothetical protein
MPEVGGGEYACLDFGEKKDGGGVGCRLYGWWGNEGKKEKKVT